MRLSLTVGIGWVCGSEAKGQLVGWWVEKVGPLGSSWMSGSSWSDGFEPQQLDSYLVSRGQVLGVPQGEQRDFTGGALRLDPGSTLRVNLGGNIPPRVRLAHAPYIEFENATLQFQKALGNFAPVVVDADLLMFGSNRIVVSGSGPPMPLQFLRTVTSPGGSLSIGPNVPPVIGTAAQPVSGQVFEFRANVAVEEMKIGPVNLLGIANRVHFNDLDAAKLELRPGWSVVLNPNGRMTVPDVVLTDSSTVLTVNGALGEMRRLQMGAGQLNFGTSGEVAPVIRELSGMVGSRIRNLGGARTLTVSVDQPGTFGGTFVDDVGGSLSLVKAGSGTLTLTADSVLPGSLVVAAGRLQFGSAEGAGGIYWGWMELDGELEFAGNAVREYGGEVDGLGRLIQSGTGTTRLNGDASGFGGSVEVRGGRLEINGAMGGAAFQVHSGLLGGTGTLGAVTAAAGSRVAPGNSIGALTVGSLQLAGSMEVEWSAATQMLDLLRVTGLLQLNDATLRFEPLEGTGVLTGGTHVIVEYGSLAGTFAQVENLPAGYRLAYGEGGNRIALIAVPEPGLVTVFSIGAMACLVRRRRGFRSDCLA